MYSVGAAWEVIEVRGATTGAGGAITEAGGEATRVGGTLTGAIGAGAMTVG